MSSSKWRDQISEDEGITRVWACGTAGCDVAVHGRFGHRQMAPVLTGLVFLFGPVPSPFRFQGWSGVGEEIWLPALAACWPASSWPWSGQSFLSICGSEADCF